MMDYLISEVIGYSREPLVLAIIFLFLILIMDGIFGIVGVLFKPLLER